MKIKKDQNSANLLDKFGFMTYCLNNCRDCVLHHYKNTIDDLVAITRKWCTDPV